jgi:SSS family solute:Na+ symporter
MTKLLTHVSLKDALVVAGGFHKMAAVDYSFNFGKRYTFWSGTLGGIFLFLSYFGVDQSQVQRYISGSSLRESRLGLMFNAVLKIPMQFSILLLGAMLFVFYQFERPPLFFDEAALKYRAEHGQAEKLSRLGQDFTAIQADKQAKVQAWLDARHTGNPQAEAMARADAVAALDRSESVRREVKDVVQGKDRRTNEADYIFIAFVLHYLPHGVIGLLVAVIFAAAMSSKASELNALGSTTTIDIYRHLVQRDASDAHYVVASKWFTALWGLFALAFALYATLSENLIQAVNILGSLFYGVLLGLFVVAFTLNWVRGTAVFCGAIAAQALIFALFWKVPDKVLSYLWYNLIGCAACMLFGVIIQAALDSTGRTPEAQATA